MKIWTSRRKRPEEDVTCKADKNTCRVLVGKPEGKIPVGRRSIRYVRMNVINKL